MVRSATEMSEVTGERFDVSERVVAVTGAAQGIGMTIARALAAAGAYPVICDIQARAASALANEITADGGTAMALEVDVAEPASVEAMVAAMLARFGRIDGLINNAALYTTLGRRPFFEITPEEWDAVMRVNVTGSFLCAKAVAPAMIEAGWGRIINISSSTVPLGVPMLCHYVTSKAAVIGLTRTMARELGPHGITVNTVLPGLTETEIENPAVNQERRRDLVARQAIPRKQVPDDLVGVMMFLVSRASEFMTGQSLLVDGGSAHL
jgi:NAD(P)-dependent dehydrogenase (short-subunit alcohol dehydrogenase family)